LKRDETCPSNKSPITPPTPGCRLGHPFRMTLPAVAPTPDLGSSDEEDTQHVVPNKSKGITVTLVLPEIRA